MRDGGGRGDVMTPMVSVLIVSYNTRELLLACIQSVIKTSCDVTYEIIVSENGSSDNSEDAVRRTFPSVTVLQNGADLGFGAAVNTGARLASGKYLAIVAPDAVMLPNTLSTLVNVAEDGGLAGPIACRLLNPDGTLQRSCARFPTPLRVVALFTRLDRLLPFARFQHYYAEPSFLNRRAWNHDGPREVETLLGAFLFLRRASFEAVGGFDERYFMYYEEIDLLRSLAAIGLGANFISSVAMIHYGGAATKQEYARMRFEQQRSLLIYLVKWHGVGAARVVQMTLLSLAIGRALRAHLGRGDRAARAASISILRGLLRMNLDDCAS